MGKAATRVGIGLVSRDGRYLVRRRAAEPLAGYWEFPGGKCREGETPREAAARECHEELGLAVVVDERPRYVKVHEYAHGLIELHFFDAGLADDRDGPDVARGFHWVASAELPSYAFPEANRDVVAELAGHQEDACPALLRSQASRKKTST